MPEFGETFDPPTKNAEAMSKFDLEFHTDNACADTVDPNTKNAEAMPKFEIQLVIQLVSENIEGFTKHEVEAAKRTKKLYHSLGCPSIAMLKNLIRMNAIKNCPVTTEDITIAKKIYGPNPSKLKGKSTRSQPPAVINNDIELMIWFSVWILCLYGEFRF